MLLDESEHLAHV